MSRVDLELLEDDELIREKIEQGVYVWQRPLRFNINKGRRAADVDPSSKDRRRKLRVVMAKERRKKRFDRRDS